MEFEGETLAQLQQQVLCSESTYVATNEIGHTQWPPLKRGIPSCLAKSYSSADILFPLPVQIQLVEHEMLKGNK